MARDFTSLKIASLQALTEIDAINDNEQLEVPCLSSGCTKAHTTIKLTIAVKEKLTKD